MNNKSQQGREGAFKLHKFPENMSNIYVEINSGHIHAWEQGLRTYPNAEYGYHKLADILPFVKLVKPRIAIRKDISGLKIISLDRFYHDEEKIVKYGLEPLKKAQILEESELEQVARWYKQTQTISKNNQMFEKIFSIHDKKYILETDLDKNFRHLNLKVLK